MLKETIPIKKLQKNAVIPTYGTEYSAGADIYAYLEEPITISPGETVLIPTGIAMEIPIGYAEADSPPSVDSLLLIKCVLSIPITAEKSSFLYTITLKILRQFLVKRESHKLFSPHICSEFLKKQIT